MSSVYTKIIVQKISSHSEHLQVRVLLVVLDIRMHLKLKKKKKAFGSWITLPRHNAKEFYFIFTLLLEECSLKKGANFLYAKFG